jgi:hypothetical protein
MGKYSLVISNITRYNLLGGGEELLLIIMTDTEMTTKADQHIGR